VPIAVTTPTGNVGSHVVRMLCQAGVRPRLLLRNPAGSTPRCVVFLSSIGTEMRHGAGFVDGLARIEQRLDAAREQTGTALLHLRCGYFMTNLLTDLNGLWAGRLTTTQPLDDPMPWVDPRAALRDAGMGEVTVATQPAPIR
jgi:hypothetical protein